jgi:hypothetical protein
VYIFIRARFRILESVSSGNDLDPVLFTCNVERMVKIKVELRLLQSVKDHVVVRHFLDNRLTDGGEVVTITRLFPFTTRKTPGTHFY